MLPDPRSRVHTKQSNRPLWPSCFLLLILFAAPLRLSAQGCTQCRDNTAATPPQTQAAYRRAITLMILTAGSIFIATVFLLRNRNPK